MTKSRLLRIFRSRAFRLTVVTMLAITLVWMGAQQQQGQRYQEIALHLLPEDQEALVHEEKIMEMLHEEQLLPATRSMDEIRLDAIETALARNPFCRSTEAYWDIEGNLHIDFQQRQPLLRIIDMSNRQYYLDESLRVMPLSERFTAHVPIVSGFIDEEMPHDGILRSPAGKRIRAWARQMQQHDFFHVVSNQIRIEKDGALVLISALGGHRFVLGDTTRWNDKLLKLKVFYREILPRKGWSRYDTVYLNFENQIVANTR